LDSSKIKNRKDIIKSGDGAQSFECLPSMHKSLALILNITKKKEEERKAGKARQAKQGRKSRKAGRRREEKKKERKEVRKEGRNYQEIEKTTYRMGENLQIIYLMSIWYLEYKKNSLNTTKRDK
jgi:uncharacterized protein YlxW (UPF0749 family)